MVVSIIRLQGTGVKTDGEEKTIGSTLNKWSVKYPRDIPEDHKVRRRNGCTGLCFWKEI